MVEDKAVEKIFYTHEAQLDQVCEYLAKLDYHKKTIHIDIDGELKPFYLSDKENFGLLIRKGLQRLLRDDIPKELSESLSPEELEEDLWFETSKHNIVLEGKDIKKVQDIVLKKIPQFCDVIIIGKGPRDSYARKGTFVCPNRCKATAEADATREIKNIDFKCQRHDLEFARDESKDYDDFIQRIVIQEPLTEAKFSSQIDYDARIVGGMLNETFIGQKKRVLMVPRSSSKIRKGTSVEKSLFFDILSVADLEEKQRILPSNKEVEEYRKAAEDPDYFDRVIEDFAPNIVGEDMVWVKKALMLSLIGGTKADDFRGDSHMLLIGDPSVGKSRFLKECAEVSHKFILTVGGGTSAAGLTIGMVKRHDGTMMAHAGALPLADGGVVLIDEFDKMSEDDRKMMHPAMEDQYVHIQKAGVELTLPTRTTVIAACNPKFSKWNNNLPWKENVNLTDTMISRFDYIFRILREFNAEKESKIASRVIFNSDESTSTKFEQSRISALINFAKTLRPKPSQAANDLLQKRYVRLVEQTKDTDLPADPRTLGALIRGATAHAKLKFKDMVDEEDVEVAIQIHKASLRSFGIDIDNQGEQTYLPSNKRELNRHETFWNCFNKVIDQNGTVSKPEVIELMAETKLFADVFAAKNFFDQMCRGVNQQLLEGPDGRFRRIT